MSIIVYGGSFNPPHLGHVAAARCALQTIHPRHMLIIPTAKPPHKDMAASSPTPQQRLDLCRQAFQGLLFTTVSAMEVRREGPSYTYETLREVRKLAPHDRIMLMVGTDMLETFEQWREFREILEHTELLAFPRTAADGPRLEAARAYLMQRYQAKVTILPLHPVETTSTQLRTLLPLRQGADLVPEKVYTELIRHRYYGAKPDLQWLQAQVQLYLEPRRVAHVIGCAQEAERLVRHFAPDLEDAYGRPLTDAQIDELVDTAREAALCHDITKKFDLPEQLRLCQKYAIMIDAQESHNAALLHAATGAALAQDRFGVCDEVADAIRYHTTGRADMRFLEKILYLADYIEPTRDFDGVDTLRHLASQPHLDALDTALETALDMSILHILSQQKSTRRRGKRAAPNAQNAPDPVHPRTRQALAFLRQARANNN